MGFNVVKLTNWGMLRKVCAELLLIRLFHLQQVHMLTSPLSVLQLDRGNYGQLVKERQIVKIQINILAVGHPELIFKAVKFVVLNNNGQLLLSL